MLPEIVENILAEMCAGEATSGHTPMAAGEKRWDTRVTICENEKTMQPMKVY